MLLGTWPVIATSGGRNDPSPVKRSKIREGNGGGKGLEGKETEGERKEGREREKAWEGGMEFRVFYVLCFSGRDTPGGAKRTYRLSSDKFLRDDLCALISYLSVE